MPFIFRPFFNGLAALHYAPDLIRCEECQMPLNRETAHWDMFTKPKSLQISSTTDGFILASPAFKARYEAEGWTGLTFRPLSNDYFDVRPVRTVRVLRHERFALRSLKPGERLPQTEIDLVRKMQEERVVVTYSESCGACGTYRCALGGGTITIARGEIPVAENEFVSSDAKLGSDDYLSADLLVGQAVRDSHYNTKRFARCSVSNKAYYQSWDQVSDAARS